MPKKKPAATKKTPKAKAAKSAKGKAKAPAHEESHDAVSNKKLDTVLQEITAQPEKQHLEQWAMVQCPYCGEEFELHVTSEDEGQSMSEDCHVCCRPISIHVHAEEDELQVSAYRS